MRMQTPAMLCRSDLRQLRLHLITPVKLRRSPNNTSCLRKMKTV